MENAVQALKTAAAVLIFIIAITTTFVMFSKAKTTADTVISMQDKQKYLDSPDVSGGILYTSSEDISGNKIPTMTKEGYRIVKFDDVVSTLYRYSIEKYGVTIIENDGTVIARFDSNTESSIIPNWLNRSQQQKEDFITQLSKNTRVNLDINNDGNINNNDGPNFNDFIKFYTYTDSRGNEGIGAEWYNETEIIKHVNAIITGNDYIINSHTYSINEETALENYKESNFIEILNTKDTSKYLEDTSEDNQKVKTDLQTQYQMPTIEIIYIIIENE